MAKVSYNKLGLKTNDEIFIIHIGDNEVEVKKYLPIEKKIEIMSNIVSTALTVDSKYFNIPQILFNLEMEILYNYTNISFTEKQKETPMKIYDTFKSTGVLSQILSICENDYQELKEWCFDITSKVYNYNMSAYGILDNLKENYNDLSFDVKSLTDDLQNPENLNLLKTVLTKLG